MGYYINPGNENFRVIVNDEYVDKSGLIAVINDTIETKRMLSCVSRPRRFGKSYAANMLEAYYDCSCDSHELFDGLEIAKNADYEKHLNQYNVLYLDITGFMAGTTLEGLPDHIMQRVLRDIRRNYSDIDADDLKEALTSIVETTGRKFIAIIDEWDAPLRTPRATEDAKTDFLEFLRSLFKSEITRKVFAAAYMTGILPVKKDGTQSAISEFTEYTIIKPGPFAPYAGFLEDEVKAICDRHDVSFEKMKGWYNGYTLYDRTGELVSVYNPNSVMRAADGGVFESYWGMSSAVYGALDYINMDFDGLGEAAEKLTAGLEIPVNTTEFKNDMVIFDSADDVLTLLLHFGYLTFVQEEKNVCRIPNYEIMAEFAGMIHKVSHKETMARLKESEQFLADIIAGDAEAVAANVQKVHAKESAPLWYNDEQALRAVIKLAFFTYRDHYIKLEELPSGTGYADMAYIPKKYDPSPAMVIELKAGGTPEEALGQMHSRNYASSLEGLDRELLLIAITYDKNDKTKPHYCRIEKAQPGDRV